jgi:hypothetical protein
MQSAGLSPYGPQPNALAIPRPHALMDHSNSSLSFSIQNSNSYSFMNQTFMLQGSHMGPTSMMSWGGSPVAGQPPTWPPPLPPAGYRLPPPSGGYWPILPPAGHPDQSPALLPHLSARDTSHHHRGHLQLEGKPVVGNASVDDTDVAAVATFFVVIDGKSFVLIFNCSIRNTSKCRMSLLLIHLCL